MGVAARDRKVQFRQRTVLFIDEIHRLNKGQQDILLPFMENGDLILLGATTENPSYELNSALLSRCRVVVFERHSEKDLLSLVERACESSQVTLDQLFDDKSRWELCRMAKGDARQLFNLFDEVLQHYRSSEGGREPLSGEELFKAVEGTSISYDKTGDEHYDCISAFIKSIRGSDVDAALYYLARMVRGGEDLVYIARRLMILASEDIGNGDPRALPLAVSGFQAVEAIGLPEGGIILAQVTTYLSCAPKSNRSYLAYKKALSTVDKHGALPIPKCLRSSRTLLSRSLGYGVDYKYAHHGYKGWVPQKFFPEGVEESKFYEPLDRGFEKTMLNYLKWLKS